MVSGRVRHVSGGGPEGGGYDEYLLDAEFLDGSNVQ